MTQNSDCFTCIEGNLQHNNIRKSIKSIIKDSTLSQRRMSFLFNLLAGSWYQGYFHYNLIKLIEECFFCFCSLKELCQIYIYIYVIILCFKELFGSHLGLEISLREDFFGLLIQYICVYNTSQFFYFLSQFVFFFWKPFIYKVYWHKVIYNCNIFSKSSDLQCNPLYAIGS